MAKPNLIVLAQSEPWCSTIARSFPEFRRVWVLNVDDLAQASIEVPNSAAIVEIPSIRAPEFCVELSRFLNNSNRLRIFSVGDERLAKWQPLLLAAGVTACYWSLLQFPSLARAIQRHTDPGIGASESMRAEIWRDLPWPPTVPSGSSSTGDR